MRIISTYKGQSSYFETSDDKINIGDPMVLLNSDMKGTMKISKYGDEVDYGWKKVTSNPPEILLNLPTNEPFNYMICTKPIWKG